MSSHSISASVIYKNERRRKTGHYRTYKTNLLNLVEEETRLQEELLRKEKALQDTQVRSKHEMGKMKRAQVQQFDEFSMQKLREKSRDYSTAHLSIAPNARTDEFHPWQFWLKPFPVRTCAVFFPFTSLSGFVLSKCLQPSFVSFPASLMARERWNRCASISGTSLLFEYLLTVLFLTLKGQDFAPVRWRRKSTKSTYSYRSSYKTRLGLKIASRRLLRQWPPRRLRLQILNKLLGALWLALLLWKQMQPLAPVALTRQDLGTCLDIVTAPQPLGPFGSHGPGSSDDNRNTRRRLDTFSSPEDEHARSAVLLRFPCEQYHTGITNWINNLWEKSNIPAYNKPVRIHCKAGSVSARLVFETRAKCQDFVARYKEDGFPLKLTVLSATPKTVISVRQSNSLEDREIGKQVAPLWRVLAAKLKVLFPDGDGDRHLHCPYAQRPFTSSQHQGSKKRRWKTCVQTCSFWKRTVVYTFCT